MNKFKVAYSHAERFGESYIRFKDPDGLQLELAEREEGAQSGWSFGGVPADKAIKGFGGAVLFSMAPKQTMHVLEHVMGLERIGEEDGLVRFRSNGDLGNRIDVNSTVIGRGIGGTGTIHHIAWRAKDLADQEQWRERVMEAGFQPTPVVDRQYFTAVYFREEGEILFEIATDPPGFEKDEPFESLGEELKLPEWFEPHRSAIEAGLPPLKIRVLEEDRT